MLEKDYNQPKNRIGLMGWSQDNGKRSNQESKFDFLATRLTRDNKKIKIVRTNRQSNLGASSQSIFSLCWHHPRLFRCCKATWPYSEKICIK